MPYSVGPAKMVGGLLPNGYMMGGSMQPTTIRPEDYVGKDGRVDVEAYKKALAKARRKDQQFFDNVGKPQAPAGGMGYTLKPNTWVP